jgi:molybdopterin-guanine dinucleotide biosynthesis protein A
MPDKIRMRLGALILAGGRSKRMGRPKELLPFSGQPLLARIAATLQRCADPVVVVAREPGQELPPLDRGVLVVHDERPDEGPLAALVRGLRFVGDAQRFGADDAVFVTGCDLPFLSAAAVAWLSRQLGEAVLVMPRAGGLLQPLAALYRPSVLAHAERLLQQGTRTPRSLAALPSARIVEEAELRAFDPELRFLRNVNTPEDYERAVQEPAP